MPATYAHYRFGDLAYPMLPSEAKKTVQRFRQLFDVGLHGPDLFFYYQPMFHTKYGELGHTYHFITGRELFEAGAARLRETPSEGGRAYLYGLLCHYALDSACHPMIRAAAAEGKAGHTEIETEFDRWLLTQDRRLPPCTQNLSGHMHLTWGECATVSQFYQPASAYTIRRSVRNMALITRVLASNNRRMLQRVFRLGGTDAAQMVMSQRPNRKCIFLNEPLKQLFDQALERYPGMAEQLTEHFFDAAPLGEEFAANFG